MALHGLRWLFLSLFNRKQFEHELIEQTMSEEFRAKRIADGVIQERNGRFEFTPSGMEMMRRVVALSDAIDRGERPDLEAKLARHKEPSHPENSPDR